MLGDSWKFFKSKFGDYEWTYSKDKQENMFKNEIKEVVEKIDKFGKAEDSLYRYRLEINGKYLLRYRK